MCIIIYKSILVISHLVHVYIERLSHLFLGKSSLLATLGNREVPVPEHIDIFHLKQEMPPSTKSAIETVMEVDAQRIRLEKEAEDLALKDSDGEWSNLEFR